MFTLRLNAAKAAALALTAGAVFLSGCSAQFDNLDDGDSRIVHHKHHRRVSPPEPGQNILHRQGDPIYNKRYNDRLYDTTYNDNGTHNNGTHNSSYDN